MDTAYQRSALRQVFVFLGLKVAGIVSYPAFQGEPAETLTFEYDDTANNNAGKGRLTRISDGSGNTRFQYDRFGRVIEKASRSFAKSTTTLLAR